MRRVLLASLMMWGAVTVGAQELNLPPGKWWENERLAERIGITGEQKDAIRGLVYEHAHRMIDLRAAVEKSELDLAALVATPDFDDDAARAAFNALVASRTSLERERFEMLLSVRGVLTADQWLQIQEIRREFRRDRERREGQRPRWREAPPPSPGG